MAGEIFYWLLNMSILGSLTGLVVLLAGRYRRLPRRFAMGLWLIPFLRLCLPAGVGSSLSLFTPMTGYLLRPVPLEVPVTLETFIDEPLLSAMNCIRQADSYSPFSYRVESRVGPFLMEDVFQTAGIVWLLGAAVLFLTMGVLYGLTRRELRDAAHLRENIYTSPKVTVPAVYGILRPRIVLPAGYEKKTPDCVLAHERAHIRHQDNFWRLLGFCVAGLHWFNPLVWLFLRRFLEDLELACDERVLAKLGQQERKAYALALVEAAESRTLFASAFGGAGIRTRIHRILSYRRLTFLSTAAFLALALAMAWVLLTNPI